MIVRKLHYNALSGNYELFRELADIDDGTVLDKMSTDMPYEIDPAIEIKPTWLYEAGDKKNGKFDPQFIWHSENGSLFD